MPSLPPRVRAWVRGEAVATAPPTHGLFASVCGCVCGRTGTQQPAITSINTHSTSAFVVVADSLTQAASMSLSTLRAQARGAPVPRQPSTLPTAPPGRWALSLGSSGGDDLALVCAIGASDGEVTCSGENSGAGVRGVRVWLCESTMMLVG